MLLVYGLEIAVVQGLPKNFEPRGHATNSIFFHNLHTESHPLRLHRPRRTDCTYSADAILRAVILSAVTFPFFARTLARLKSFAQPFKRRRLGAYHEECAIRLRAFRQDLAS